MKALPVYREICRKCKSKNTRSYSKWNETIVEIVCKDCGHRKNKDAK